MSERNTVVRKFWNLRLWAAAVWWVASGCVVQPAQGAYGQLPVFFFENRGQLASSDILYMAKGPELTGYFGPNQVLLTMGSSTYRVSFPGANPEPTLEASQPLGGNINFLLGKAGRWKTNLPAFDRGHSLNRHREHIGQIGDDDFRATGYTRLQIRQLIFDQDFRRINLQIRIIITALRIRQQRHFAHHPLETLVRQ